MLRLLVCTFLLTAAQAGLVRVPKIYNALISSDENLQPSHAYPIIEPVFRTTSLGVAFPPILVNSPPNKGENYKPEGYNSEGDQRVENKENIETRKDVPQLSYHGTLFPVTYDPFFPYAYRNDFLYPALPYIQPHQAYVDLKHVENKKQEREEQVNPAANFKKNPDIPDVPPPPLPFRQKEKQKSR